MGELGTDRVADHVAAAETDAARAALADLVAAAPDDRKATLQSLRSLADEHPSRFDGLAPALAAYLTDDVRAIRLTTVKTFVTLAESDPSVVVPAVDSLAARLADDDEFYYVRARAAEALGYVALDRPDAVASPEVLADLRIGLAFDEAPVRRKLAKAIECVALGDPARLGHLVDRLVDHLDDGSTLVRYHLCTALVAVGTVHPEKLAPADEPLVARLDDEIPYVRGRAAEALASLAATGRAISISAERVADLIESDEQFVADRGRALAAHVTGVDVPGAAPTGDAGRCAESTADREIGTLASVSATTETAVEAMTAPDADGECSHCGLALPDPGPPVCPRCGAPR